MDTSDWTLYMKKVHEEIEEEAKKQRWIVTCHAIKRAIVLMAVIATAIFGYINEVYLTGNLFQVDLKTYFLHYFSEEISDDLAQVFDLGITTVCAICMIYTLYWIGFFHWIGSGNSNYRYAKYPNIERTVKYMDGLMGAKNNEDAMKILTGKNE